MFPIACKNYIIDFCSYENIKMKFYKYQGAGNDFIIVDNRKGDIDHQNPAFIAEICDRRFGVGGDGMMFLQDKSGYDFEMIYYNSDGQPSSMCGNGGRCMVAFAHDLGVIEGETNFLAVDGEHYAKISDSGTWVSLQMIDVDMIKKEGHDYVLNTGSPHYVHFTSGLDQKNMFEEGRRIRYNDTYTKEGINVNFVEDKGDYLFVRTYERGVENETYACGTGVTAVALAMAKHRQVIGTISTQVKVLGGDLTVRFNYDGKRFYDIYLEGPAKKVFEGNIEL